MEMLSERWTHFARGISLMIFAAPPSIHTEPILRSPLRSMKKESHVCRMCPKPIGRPFAHEGSFGRYTKKLKTLRASLKCNSRRGVK